MPYVIRPRKLRNMAAGLLCAAALVAALPSGAAAASTSACASGSTSTPFAALGDSALYTLLTGAGFESSASGWTLSDAEAIGAGATAESAPSGHALAIEPGGSALSPQFCIDVEEPSFRFYVRQSGDGDRGSSLGVFIVWSDVYGFRHYTPVASVTGSSTWAPTPVLPLATKLPLWMPGATLNAQLQFKAEGPASWAIDDVYIDPHSR
ncbi:MAG TPA: hypothetical protein VEJ23_04260 [Solirubrobacteraceae bacterium]|nr:hypothetical protein [Solirubrobacteraceae bacterium]